MQTVVGVLRGGPSREHEVSLKSGAAILAHLPPEKFSVRDIYIDKQGHWHERGRPSSPAKILHQVDTVLIGLHGEYGEDGEVQKLLERFGVKYSGSDPLGSFVAMHKLMSKMRAKDAGLLTPAFTYISRDADLDAAASEIVRSFHQPVVVKPIGWGSSVGISLVGGFSPVHTALERLVAEGAPGILVEEYIRGAEATVGVVENLRGEALYALPTVEIIPQSGDMFLYEEKYSPKTREVVPGNFSRQDTEELIRAAKLMHRTLGLRHYSRSDFRVTPKGVYYLETNSLPGLTPDSLFPKSLKAVGVPLSDFLTHLVGLSLAR